MLSEVPLVALKVPCQVDPIAEWLVGGLLYDFSGGCSCALVMGVNVVYEDVYTRTNRLRPIEVPTPDVPYHDDTFSELKLSVGNETIWKG